MADRLTPEARSLLMSKVRSKGTKIERVVELNLRASGIRYTRHPNLIGSPDFLLEDFGTALFIDGCFWHLCPKHCRIPDGNARFWVKKLLGNVVRDAVNRVALRDLYGLNVAVIWEHDLMS